MKKLILLTVLCLILVAYVIGKSDFIFYCNDNNCVLIEPTDSRRLSGRKKERKEKKEEKSDADEADEEEDITEDCK